VRSDKYAQHFSYVVSCCFFQGLREPFRVQPSGATAIYLMIRAAQIPIPGELEGLMPLMAAAA